MLQHTLLRWKGGARIESRSTVSLHYPLVFLDKIKQW